MCWPKESHSAVLTILLNFLIEHKGKAILVKIGFSIIVKKNIKEFFLFTPIIYNN
jgi:hypothetical protein